MTTRLRPHPSPGRNPHPSPVARGERRRPGPRLAGTTGLRASVDASLRRSLDRPPGAAPGGRADWSFAQLLATAQLSPDAAWKLYRSSEEYLQLRVLLRALGQLPAGPHAPQDARADYEFCLHALGRLGDLLEVEKISKHYRAYYSPEVQLTGYLYSTLLTAFTLLPSYLLNGKEYYVSDTVLDQCGSLQNVFSQTCREIQRHFENLAPHTLLQVRADVQRSLVYFDRTWCRFEIPALEEIEAIHRQACRPLIAAIQVDQQLTEFERARPKGAASGSRPIREQVQRSRLMEKVCELNVLANLDGKGRSDLDLAAVVEAEKIAAAQVCGEYYHVLHGTLGPVAAGQPAHGSSGCASPVLVRLARTLLSRFAALRNLLKRYARSLYQVNSHLANNPDLVTALERFEAAWELCQKYLLTPKYKQLALHAFSLVTQVPDRSFHIALQDLEPELLIKVSHALLLHEMLGERGGARAAHASKHAAKGPAGPGRGAELPRLASAAELPEAASVCAVFLPPSERALCAETTAAVGKLSEDQLRAVQEALVHPESRPGTAASLAPGEGGAARLGSADRSARAARRPVPPEQPCPPRLVPATPLRDETKESVKLLDTSIGALEEPHDVCEESDDELPPLDQLTLPERPMTVDVAEAADPAVRSVVAHVSTLGMHLQRHDANGWNELIQIVLQGVIFAAKGCGEGPTTKR